MEISNMYNYVEMLKMVFCEPQNSFFFPLNSQKNKISKKFCDNNSKIYNK